ncbi:DUF2795 domain-containing protein [Streptomyces sp. NPDC053474]|uniref:DUF2795 domain-containing protein n=1 Tax=Streptomyces sp. NPDC053474 TaxID=3365704 RepID=UPI0037D5D0DE
MSDRGQNKTGPLRDDELKRELRGHLLSGHETRAREERALEPSGEDQPAVDPMPVPPRPGSTPPGVTPREVELRGELARHLSRRAYPLHRDELVRTLRDHHAPDLLVDLAARLPDDRPYASAQDIARGLADD